MADIGQNRDFLGHLQCDEIISMHTMEASLDDVFIRTTGNREPGQ